MVIHVNKTLSKTLQQVSVCQLCADTLPLPPKPIVQISEKAKVLIIG